MKRGIVSKITVLLVFLLTAAAFIYIFAYPVCNQIPAMGHLEFSDALWNLRRMDVFVQVLLVFTCALGILTFFAEKVKK